MSWLKEWARSCADWQLKLKSHHFLATLSHSLLPPPHLATSISLNMGPDRKPLGRAVERASVLEREMRLYSRAMRPSSGEEGRNMSAFFPHISAKDASVLNERTNMRVTFIGERDLELRTPGNVIYELKRETTVSTLPWPGILCIEIQADSPGSRHPSPRELLSR